MESKTEAKAVEYKTTELGRSYILLFAGKGSRMEQLLRAFTCGGGCTLDEARLHSATIAQDQKTQLAAEKDKDLAVLRKQVIKCHEDVLLDIDKLFSEAVSKGYLEKI